MILVFGGLGQLGQELSAHAAQQGVRVASFGRQAADVTDPKAVAAAIDRVRPTLIVNAAAYNQVDKAESEPLVAERVNGLGPRVLAEAAGIKGLPFVHISTDYVFDGRKSGAYREEDAVAPLGVYGSSKARGEEGVRNGLREHLILRTSWLFGAHGSNFLTRMLRLAAEREAFDVVVDQTGTPTDAGDLARGILVAAAAVARGAEPWGTYHVAGAGVASRYDFACAVVATQAALTGRRPTVNPVATADRPTAATRPLNSALDSSRFAVAFGFRVGDWRPAVERTVARIFSGRAAA